ncbi:MAG: Rossmann-like fold-containing protein, partial [archaeon]|nr:Rossmann-like fold-containing protein [archaeon]
IYKGNLFYPFRNEKFTTIVWNFPFCNTKAKSYLEKSVFDYQYKSLERFLKEAKKHLKKNGRIILGFSPDLGDEKLLKKIIHKKGYGQKLICEKKSTQSHVRGAQKRVRYQLFELRPN